MEITEVRVSLREGPAGPGAGVGRTGPPGASAGGEKRLRAYATLTFDHCFVVRNIKIIDGKNGLFVAMPSRKPKVACARCHFKGQVGDRYCAQCGAPMPRPEGLAAASGEADAQGHRDIAHPITAEFRHYLQRQILEAYEAERAKGQAETPHPVVEADDRTS